MSKAEKIIATAESVEGDKSLVEAFKASEKVTTVSYAPGAGGGFAMTPALRMTPK